MKDLLAAVLLVCGVAMLPDQSQAGDADHHRQEAGTPGHPHADARLRTMQRLQRKHDMRRIYHDRRPRRPMRSL